MRSPTFYSAVFAIIRNERGEILWQKRQNTGHRDGEYQLPSGHLEGVETMEEALIREMQEEIGITVTQAQIQHITHRVGLDRTYFSIYFEIEKYSGEIQNLEPNKCGELRWVNLDSIRNDPLFAYDVEVLEHIEQGIAFSETQKKDV